MRTDPPKHFFFSTGRLRSRWRLCRLTLDSAVGGFAALRWTAVRGFAALRMSRPPCGEMRHTPRGYGAFVFA